MTERMALCHGAHSRARQTLDNNRVALSTAFTRNGVNRTVGAIDLEANGFFSEIPPEVVDEEGNPVVISEVASALPQRRAPFTRLGTRCNTLR